MVTWPPGAEESRMPVFLHKKSHPHKQTHEAKPSSLFPHFSTFLGQEEQEENSTPNLPAFIPPPSVAAPPPKKLIYSLSSGACLASFPTRSRSRRISHGTSPSSGSSFLSPPPKSSSFCSDDDEAQSSHAELELELPPINIFDCLKTLLSQLAATISAAKIAYAHQQAALNPYNMQQGEGIDRSNVAATDKAMVKELGRLSHLHGQLSLVPHMKLQEQYCCKCGEEAADWMQEEEEGMLKRYEGIITSFHGEIRKKEAVTVALKEILAKSLLHAEKLERRVKALEAQLMSPN